MLDSLRSLAAALLASVLLAPACSPSSELELEEDVANQDEAIAQFDRNRILSDAEMLDTNALSATQVDAFLKRPYPDYDDYPSCLSNMRFGGRTAGALIVEAARRHGLNPLFLIAHLQKESALVGDTSATCPDDLIVQAFGCGCPDHQACDPQFAGFEKQLDCAGKLTKSYLDDLSAGRSTISGWRVGSPKQTLDPYTVTPATRAAAVLYTYTPWVGDKTAGGNRAPFGNYLFWQNWSQFAKTFGYRAPTSGGGSAPAESCEDSWDCHGGVTGSGVVCSTSGATAGQCIEACHTSSDCGAGGQCDTTKFPWQCTNPLPELGTPCTSSEQCNGGRTGTSRVCGASSKVCILCCHDTAEDCPSGSTCDKSGSAWQCRVP
jgi:hypothetical protein